MNRFEQLRLVFVLLLAIVVARLGYLQVVQGNHYQLLAERNRIRYVPQPSPRGLILDRQGRVLATNQTLFQAAIVPQEADNIDELIAQVSMIEGEPIQTLRRRFRHNRMYPFVPSIITAFLPKEKALVLEEERWRLPGLHVLPTTVRRYPYREAVAHLLGYLSKPKAEEIELLKRYGVRPNYLVGRVGIEKEFDSILRGSPGGQLVEVNHQGHSQRLMDHREALVGRSVQLTVDAQLQSLILQVFQSQPGACVVLRPETGEVLAMVSNPAFNPEAFATGDNEAVTAYLSNGLHPLLNRATRGTYPPGSVAKLIVAAAALEAQVINEHTRIHCPGGLTIGDRTIHCWNRDGHGPVNLEEAIRYSCNVFFMRLGIWLGLERLRSTYERVGFSHETGWPLGEQPGHLPERRLTQGEVAMFSIGQGPFLVTPLQVALVAALFASDGWVVQPWVVAGLDGQPKRGKSNRYRVGFSPAIYGTIKRAMASVVAEPDGTGRRAFTDSVSIAGKTGTAQTHKPGLTHGWFLGYCPVEDPRVAMAIMTEYGGSGGDLPAVVARAVCEYVVATGL